jgi:hypothetical protein
VIAYALGILERALEPFPEALAVYKQARLEQMDVSAVSCLPDLNVSSVSVVN